MYEKAELDGIVFGKDGLIPAIAQDVENGDILMLAWMNREALELTIRTGQAHYYSRSRAELWLKGETSGHFQRVREILLDCDSDALLLRIDQTGAACHTGNRSCFYRDIDGTEIDYMKTAPLKRPSDALLELQEVISDRKAHPKEGSYTNYLFDKGIDKMLKKVGEESSEIIIAAKNPDKSDLIAEIADMMFHVSVVMAERGVSWRDVCAELEGRQKSR